MTTFAKPNRPLTWLITGTSSGFGESLARLVLANGHKLIATSRNLSRNPDFVAEVNAHGNGSKWLKLDVDNQNSDKFIESLEESGDKIDVLVNNAGYSIYGPMETLTEEELRAQMDTLYFGPVRLIRAVLPHMRKRKYGVIVNISSGAGLEGRDSMGGYAGAKAALDGMSKVLAKEVAPFGIRTLTVTLGTFNTSFGDATRVGKTPLPDVYKGSVADQMIQIMSSGTFKPNGDKDKAMKALYEVVIGEGVGKGHEAESLLPLGQDMTVRVKTVQEYLGHALEVFGDVCNNVSLEKK
ncbi:putative short-chain oxidoreductase [Annulohypoxylon maeteangense]|uniref:putative short-chain oxidoreductase n=1 Tax=Annulohypoxylon maeteangense TaxID=1927788 RepID=UPI0020085D66|nr:putative short-chain oxidoreductase [Annulohypoxylon maeteangense]KAI0885455.1 putative short-chain oxidoreductase [Annulohypoxylon maeteangense]